MSQAERVAPEPETETEAPPDTNELLERMRVSLRRVRAARQLSDKFDGASFHMADTFEALDAALSNGAALPTNWTTKETEPSLAPEEWAVVSMLLDINRMPGRTYIRKYKVWVDKLRGKVREIVRRSYPG